jgi:hypothetical protein
MAEESFQIYMSSKFADIYNTSYLNDVTFHLPQIDIDDQYHIYLSVVNASIPLSYYNVNNNNNTLNYQLSGGSAITIVLTNGNYNVNTLMTLLNSVLTNFTVSYNSITNKYNFVHATTDFTFYNTSTCFSILGLTSNDQLSIARILPSNRCINLSPLRTFMISSNLKTGNVNLSATEILNILCTIPIVSNNTGVVNYSNDNDFKCNLYTNVLGSINIKITDQDGNNIDFNGVNWFLTLQLDIIKYTE